MRSILVLSVLIAGAASAQVPSAAIHAFIGDDSTHALDPVNATAFCGQTLTAQWAVDAPDNTTTVCNGGVFTIWLTTATACEGAAPDAGVLATPPVNSTTFSSSVSPAFGADTMISAGLLPADFCTGDVAQTDLTFTLCAGMSVGTADITGALNCTTPQFIVNQNITTFRLDNHPPDPVTLNAIPLDEQVSMQIPDAPATADLGPTPFDFFLQEVPDGGTDLTGTVPTNLDGWTKVSSSVTPPYKISGLTDGVTYAFSAITNDEADNHSTPSQVVEATPQKAYGFWSAYVADGGKTGCSVGGGGAFALGSLAVVMLWLARRRAS